MTRQKKRLRNRLVIVIEEANTMSIADAKRNMKKAILEVARIRENLQSLQK